jgi:hypothetical protein
MCGNGSDMMVLEQKGARLPRGCEREESHRGIGKEVDTMGGRNEAGTKVVRLLWRAISVSRDSFLPCVRDEGACPS